MTTGWAPTVEHLEPAKDANALTEVRSLLERMVMAYSSTVLRLFSAPRILIEPHSGAVAISFLWCSARLQRGLAP